MLTSCNFKLATLPLLIAAAMMFAGCGGRSAKKVNLNDESRKEALTETVKQKLDSLAHCLSDMGDIPLYSQISDGTFSLSEKQKMVKPDYLLGFEEFRNLVTWRQKYRAVMMYNADIRIAMLYDMPVKQYQKILYSLYVDIDNPVLLQLCSEKGDTLANIGKTPASIMNEFYDEEAKNQTLSLYWEAVSGGLVETIYILSQNTDEFITAFDDNDVVELTQRFGIIYQAVDELIEYYPEMKEIRKALTPLSKIKAKNVKSFASELYSLKKVISETRNEMLGIV